MNVAKHIEAILFVAGEPLSTSDISRALLLDESTVLESLQALANELSNRDSGIQLNEISGGYQLSTRPECAETIGRLLARASNKLSRPALETVAIIAYRQPITIPEIEAVRGVSVGGVVKTLLERKLIQEAGKKQTIGRPTLYTTTPDFLHYFAINDLSELPQLEELLDLEATPSQTVLNVDINLPTTGEDKLTPLSVDNTTSTSDESVTVDFEPEKDQVSSDE